MLSMAICQTNNYHTLLYFIIAVYVHNLANCIFFRRFLISKIIIALRLTKFY